MRTLNAILPRLSHSIATLLLIWVSESSAAAEHAVSPVPTSTNTPASATAEPVYPRIFSVLPNPVRAVPGPQVLLINGKEFRNGCSVIIRDKQTKEQWNKFKQAVRQMDQIVVTPNFASAEGTWSVEVINPGGFSSGEFAFPVVAPEKIAKWKRENSGSKWAYAALVVLCLIAVGGLWSHFWLRPKTLARLRHHIQSGARDRFAQDLHDRASADVAYLANVADRTLQDRSNLPAELREPIQKIYSAARDVEMAIGDVIWAADLQNENLRQLAPRLHQRIRERLQPMNIEPDFSGWPVPVPNVPISADTARESLYLTHEIINNVIKHARAKKLFCGLSVEGSSVIFVFRDDGIGFDPNVDRLGRGLPNMRSRAEKVGGTVDMNSKLGAGSDIRIALPICTKAISIGEPVGHLPTRR